MHFARVLGPLVATAKIRPLEGYRLLWIEPTDARGRPSGEPLVAVDAGQYGHGEWVYFVTSREASLPLRDSFCAVDAAIVGKVDCVDLADGVSTFGCAPAPNEAPAATRRAATAAPATTAPATAAPATAAPATTAPAAADATGTP